MPQHRQLQLLWHLHLTPRDRHAFGVLQPRLQPYNRFRVQLHALQRRRKRAVDTGHGLLTRQPRLRLQRWKPAQAGPKRPQARTRGRDAQGAADVTAHAQRAAAKGNQRALAAATAAWCEGAAARVLGAAEDVVDRLGDHHGRGHVRLDVQHGAGGEQHVDKRAVVGGGLVGQRGEAESGILAHDLEVVFDGDGEAVEGANKLAGLCEMLVSGAGGGEGKIEEGFGETVRLEASVLVSQAERSAPGCRVGHLGALGAIPAGGQRQPSCRRPW